MRNTILKRAWQAFGHACLVPQSRGAIVMAALLLAATNLFATATVTLLSGGPNPNAKIASAAYVDGDITTNAEYNTPCGIAADLSGNYLFVADRSNNVIRVLEFDLNWTSTLLTLSTNGLNLVTNFFRNPIGVAIDSSYNLFVLNRGNGSNGNVLEFAIDEDLFATLVATNAANLTNAVGLALDFNDNIYVTLQSNKVLKITSPGVSSVVATVPNAGASLQGLVVKYNGMLAVCDAGRNGIYLINPTNGLVTTNAGFNGVGDFYSTLNRDPIAIARFSQPAGVSETGDGSLIVADFGNHRVKVVTSTSVTNLYGIRSNFWFNPYPGLTIGAGTVVVPDRPTNDVQSRLPYGVTIAPDGSVYVTENYWSVIRKVTGSSIKPPLYPPLAPENLVATPGYGQVILTWTASASPGVTNYNIKRATISGGSGGAYTNNIIGSTSGTSYTDTGVDDGTTYYYVVSAVSSTVGEGPNSSEASATPLFSPIPVNLTVTNYNFGPVLLTWSTSAGATSYNVKRSTSTGTETTIANTTSANYSDSGALEGTTYFYVISALNSGGESSNSVEVSYTPPIPPPPAPRIGWFDYEGNYQIGFFTVLHVVSGGNYYTANNDLLIAIDPNTNGVSHGVSTYYITTNGPQPVLTNPTNGFNPPFYQDGLPPYVTPLFNLPLSPTTMSYMPDVVIQAVNIGPGGAGPVSTAEFRFLVGNPTIAGNNAAQFTISDITTNVTIWYTIDGSIPTNAPPSIGPITLTNGNSATLSLNLVSNLLFQARAFRPGFQPSGVSVQSFTAANFLPNTISFGFAFGEASSDFVASPGQTFYAPVTLAPLPATEIYSLQFNLTVTNAGPNPGPAITPGAFDFESMLVKPDTNTGYYLTIPTYMFIGDETGPIPAGQIITYEGTNFVNLVTTNLSLNLLGVGWLERYTKTNLYNTLSQDLIQYSMAHDDLFIQGNGQVILGGFNFQVPVTAGPGQTYQIQIGRPSATSDGIGAPGSSVFILAPTNGSLGGGAINSIKNVTMGQRKYIVGDAYPFRWFNAGDFGDTNLDNADVEQVFEAAIYELNSPAAQAPGSDFFDSMDSCCDVGILNPTTGYYENTYIGALEPVLFDGNDTTINEIAFGDGVLDVCDVFVTYRRSLDPSLTWYRRFWTNGVRVAETTPNLFTSGVAMASKSKSSPVVSKMVQSASSSQQTGNTSITNQPKVIFTAGDCQTNAGSTIQIPITATIFGSYPLRVLMLNLSVVPIDGSPGLTTPVTFSYNSALGSPWTTDQRGNGNYSAVWLDNTITGLAGNVSIGTLTVTIPTNATSLSAYAVHFDHASASPNGLAAFPKQAMTGLITFSSRTNSSWGDGIPDAWRLRYFLTLNNLLSATNADADGDGVNNLQEYLAGTDPTDPTSFFKTIGNDQGAAQQQQDCVISWPSAIGKQYVIQRSPSLSTPFWTSVGTNSGNGTIMEFHDTSGGGIRYYRVFVQ
ncbi:MAG: FN3 associated domain-containing protein [Verrucomicrobiia bacterium]